MDPTTLTLHTGFTVGDVDERIFGGFLEHMGRSVYEGVYDPASAHADAQGLRTDVLGALDRLHLPLVRYPGGNFVSGYHWEDGVGPRPERPTLRELAWSSIEPNDFGTDEFMDLCAKLDWTPMLAVNLGTGSPEEARNWVEYCNSPAGTRYADQRVANGYDAPHGVPIWCLGNEMDGPWQLGHRPAKEYAIVAKQAARMMKIVDPSIELVACGSSLPDMSTYLSWDQEVLEYLGGSADYISLHRYVGNHNDDTADFLAVTNSVDAQIEAVDSLCRFVQAKRKGRRRPMLCFDEWNVWYKNMEMDGANKFAPPLIEETYNLEDALVVAGFLNSFIRHADVVRIANIAQLVNVIAPVRTRGDDLLIQSIFHVFEQFSRRRTGTSLQCAVDGPSYDAATYGATPMLDASAIHDTKGHRLHVFATNRSVDEQMDLTINLADAPLTGISSSVIVTADDPKAHNTFDDQQVVTAQEYEANKLIDGSAICQLPPLSFVALTFELA